ncbi:HIT family protein [Vairimorpha necatrix]|uniref:HIT family protein n=1 Tax=Vairimorpha necatrix TaxID=6039 RepID=A0AAX4JHP3_9MICR
MSSCVFCSLIGSSSVLYESPHSFVLLDRFPLSSGHLLVIPKVHHPSLHEYEDHEVSDILSVCIKMVKKYKFKKYNILQNTGNYQSVFHVHFHVVPCHETERLKIEWSSKKMTDAEYSEYHQQYQQCQQ